MSKLTLHGYPQGTVPCHSTTLSQRGTLNYHVSLPATGEYPPHSACDLISLNPPCLLALLPDLPTSAETWDETQSPSVTGTFQHPRPKNGETDTHEGRVTISGGQRPTDDVGAEIPTTNRTIVLLILKDTVPSTMSSESSKDAKSEFASAESSYHFSPASAPTAASIPAPSAFEAMPSEGVHCPDHPISERSLTSNIVTQSPRR